MNSGISLARNVGSVLDANLERNPYSNCGIMDPSGCGHCAQGWG
jgi:hypothetical protein